MQIIRLPRGLQARAAALARRCEETVRLSRPRDRDPVRFLLSGGMVRVEFEALRECRLAWMGQIEEWRAATRDKGLKVLLDEELRRLDQLTRAESEEERAAKKARRRAFNRDRVNRHYYRERARQLGIVDEDGKAVDMAALAAVKKPSTRAKLEQAVRELEEMAA
jgi:hypothetical protein